MTTKRSFADNPDLRLHEEITLLALRDEQGTFHIGPAFQFAAGGAILAELLFEERVAVDESGRKPMLTVKRRGATGDDLVDECLERVAQARRRGSVQSWVSRFAHTRRLGPRLAVRLCQRGILKADEGRVLWLFRRRIYPERDPRPERKLIERIRRALASDSREVDARTVAVISLAKCAGLLRLNLDREFLRRRKTRLEKLVRGEVIGDATQQAIQAMQAAVVAATMVPVMASTVGH
jgi:hypothetical protein